MKTKLQLSFLLILTSCFCFAQAPSIKWQKTYGGSEDDQARAIHQTTDGGYIVAGFSKSGDGQVIGHHGGFEYDYWVVKTKGSGAIQWEKSLGGNDLDIANAAEQTADGGYVIAGASASNDGDVSGGHGDDDYWIVKLDAGGNIIWQKALGGIADDVAQSVEQTADGGYIIAGTSSSFNGDVTGNHGGNDYWVVKLDGNGNLLWEKSLGGTGSDVCTAVQQTKDGGYILAGFTNSTNGDVTGNHGSDDYWIVKLNASGTLLWQKTYGGSNLDEAYSIAQSSDGGFFVAGQSESQDGNVTGNHGTTGDYWIIKLSKTGTLLWEQALGGTDYDIAFNVSATKDGGCVATGTARSTDGDVSNPHGNYDYWIVKINSAGTLNWQLSLGGSDYDEAYSIEQIAGGYIVAGFTFSNDGDVTNNHGNNDFWVVKLKNAASQFDEVASNYRMENFFLNPNLANVEAKDALSVYPTVNNGAFTLDLNTGDSDDHHAEIELLNSAGEIISTNQTSFSNGILRMEMKPDPKEAEGIYFVRVTVEDQVYVQRVFYTR